MNLPKKIVLITATLLLGLCAACQMAPRTQESEQDKTVAVSPLGRPGMGNKVNRTIAISTQNMKLYPSIVQVRVGETVRFLVTNQDRKKHEFVIGPDEGGVYENERSESKHEVKRSNEIELEPGEAKEIVWNFGSKGIVEFSCHLPGHYQAGMHGQVMVNP